MAISILQQMKLNQERKIAEAKAKAAASVQPDSKQEKVPESEHCDPVAPELAKPATGGVLARISETEPKSLPAVSAKSGSGLLTRVTQTAAAKIEANADESDYLFREEPRDFRELLNRFDTLLARDTGIDDFNVDTCRRYVELIYTDLQKQPELDGLIIDKDVANIIHFIRTVRERALDAGVKKKETAVKKASQPKAKNRFGDKGLTLDLNSLPTDLKALSDSDEWSM